MFSCKYDGYEEDSSSSNSTDNEQDFRNADAFEKMMNLELEADMKTLTQCYRGREAATSKAEKLDTQTNDELLYDPGEDDANTEWVKKLQENSQGGETGSDETDAVLNCPGCMTLLCLNCQRHAKYKTQYRALFTFNCKVEDKPLHLPPGSDTSNLSKVTIEDSPSIHESDNSDIFHRVICEVCNTPVGLCDSAGVYHLFGVLASHS
ncbi:unnamed protein product [Mesocestoides corti]|uniref:E2F associated phosphoprotein n=1 Tax=Mesocestoides corti TaxID=53468 RepID=A0A0R3UKB0_MESCO|nr:unnamed protein product [Mesocestoides corti]